MDYWQVQDTIYAELMWRSYSDYYDYFTKAQKEYDMD